MDALSYTIEKFKASNLYMMAGKIGPCHKIPEREIYPLAVKFKTLPTSVQSFLGELATQFGTYEIELPGDYRLTASVHVRRESDLRLVVRTRKLKEFTIQEHGQITYHDVESADCRIHHLKPVEDFFQKVDDFNLCRGFA